jgi:hypothetical protein
MLGEYAIIVLAVVLYLARARPQPYLWFHKKSFASVSTSAHGTRADYILMCLRLVFFLWFAIAGVAINSALSPTSWHYFTLHNIYLLTAYYALAFMSSFFGLFHAYFSQFYTPSAPSVEIFSKIVAVLFEVSGSSAIFVTFVNFVLLSAKPDFFNIMQHGSTSFCQIIELWLNNIDVSAPDVIVALGWPMFYIVFITPIVLLGVRGWPYDFLSIENPSCFVWYNVLMILFVLFYFLWMGLFVSKRRIVANLNNTAHNDAAIMQAPAVTSSGNFDPRRAIELGNRHEQTLDAVASR